jgi:hypothetical protein
MHITMLSYPVFRLVLWSMEDAEALSRSVQEGAVGVTGVRGCV